MYFKGPITSDVSASTTETGASLYLSLIEVSSLIFKYINLPVQRLKSKRENKSISLVSVLFSDLAVMYS